jgi:NTE family protein
MKSSLRLITVLLISSVIQPCMAQTQDRPPGRVGIALSGGSALGLAHIGVFRYFEEHHIPIDDIAGTSMGGLVGGLYAAGMDSSQITEIVEQADFGVLLSPSQRFIDQPVVDKQRWNRAYGSFTLRFRKGFSLPAGLNPGESLSLLLSRTTLAYSSVTNFDELPTPFRCVATDLISGNAIVLGRGSLAQAMRATMSLPAVFTPVKRDGMVLVDGGIVENIPVEVVRQMGAQTVIAVALKTPKANPDRLKSLLDILHESVNVAIAQNERRSLASADLIISVDTTKFTGTDYSKWKQIIQAGYDAAKSKAAELTKFEVSAEEWERYLQSRRTRSRPAEKQGAVVVVNSPVASFQQNAQAEIHRRLGDRVVSQQKLEDTLTGMVAATAVPGATYEWQKDPGKVEGYKVNFAQRPGQQFLVRPSFAYGLSPGEPDRATLRVSTTTVFANAYRSRLLSAIYIGYDPGIQLEYYAPSGGSSYFVAPALFIQRYHVNSYQGPVRRSDTRDRFGGWLYGGIGTWRFSQLRIGAQAGYDSYSSSQTVDGVKAESGGFIMPELRWIYNSQDSGGLPTHGTLTEGSIGYAFRNVSYPYLQHDFSTFFPVGRTLTLFGINQVGSSFGKKLDYFEQFTAGGPAQLSAFRYQEFHANTLVTGGTGVTILGPSILSVYPRLALWYEVGRFDLGSQGWQTHQSSSTGIFVPTPLGAAGISLSFDENGRARFRLLIGRF